MPTATTDKREHIHMVIASQDQIELNTKAGIGKIPNTLHTEMRPQTHTERALHIAEAKSDERQMNRPKNRVEKKHSLYNTYMNT